ncbi:MAG: STAS domain-containing protein [Actinomycetota bacterium]|nr:STAS domain-containing protein [Actinomycetota bacterium]
MQHTLAPVRDGFLTEVTAPLGVAVTSQGHHLVVLSGKLDAGCLADVRPTLLRTVSSGTGPMHVDLGSAELGDAAAVGLLVEAHHLALRCGRRLVVVEASARSARLLRAVRVLPRGWRRLSATEQPTALAGPGGVAALTA